MQMKGKNTRGCVGMKRLKKQQRNMTMQLVEMNQKKLAKERRLKRYHERVKQYNQNRVFQNKENSTNKLVEMLEDIQTIGCKGGKTILE